jgi:hypothetical protein
MLGEALAEHFFPLGAAKPATYTPGNPNAMPSATLGGSCLRPRHAS